MFNPLKGLGDMKKLRDQAVAMQRELAKEVVTVEKNGVTIIMTGDQKIDKVIIDGRDERRVAQAIAEAIQKTQEIAARKLTQMPGMFGQ